MELLFTLGQATTHYGIADKTTAAIRKDLFAWTSRNFEGNPYLDRRSVQGLGFNGDDSIN